MQINRLFEIVYILLDKKTVTSRELADRFEVSTRTIFRKQKATSPQMRDSSQVPDGFREPVYRSSSG
jgi:hypothetical protein